MKKRLIIVDVSNFIFRAFFAIRPLTAPDGTPVNAVYGVYTMLVKMLAEHKPTHIVLARDTAGGSFRNELYDQYKANRSEPPEDLVPQFALIEELMNKMALPNISNDRYEADDLIGSLCTQWKDQFEEILIASGDKDLMQFVDGPVKMLDTMKDKTYGPNDVFEKMGVRPDQIVDYLSMVGDSSDNIPGMRGIGAKGAAKLLEEYNTLENCIQHKDQMKGKKLIEAFSDHLESGLLSKKLIQIVVDVPIEISIEQAAYRFEARPELLAYLERLGFKSAIKKLLELPKIKDEDSVELPAFLQEESQKPTDTILISNREALEQEMKMIQASSAIAYITEYDSTDILEKQLLGVAYSIDGIRGVYIALKHSESSLDGEDEKKLLDLLWSEGHREICSHEMKRDYSYARVQDLKINAPTFDIAQVHYNLSSSGRHDLASMADEFCGLKLKEAGLKKGQHLHFLEIAEAAFIGAQKACIIYSLAESFKKRLKELELESIYYEIDDPTIAILSEMESTGIRVDSSVLEELEAEFSSSLEQIESKIQQVSGEKINLNSPKQVGELLFEKLGLPVVKKTKTGVSTDVEVLEELQAMNVSEVPGLLLQYRELGKILSTYVKALPQLIHSKSGRVHTHFQQNVAQTGRLSSVNPNLQNIPVRSEHGKKVRKAFIPRAGWTLLAADYSQVELRLLAHFSQDPTMIEAFINNQDIHAQTAAEVLDVPLDKVSANQRSIAKAVNFGLMYGQSSFGLSKALKISRKEAMDYITKYFARFSKVKAYLDSLKEACERTGYAQTYHGRKRLLPDIHSQNRTIKSQAERMAVNSPIQGTAADIIKIAMIKIDKTLKEQQLASKMLLQVHDELIFEVPEDEIEKMRCIVKEAMEGVVELRVPLNIDMGTGANWFDLK
jgi:DNA polymerase I